MSDCGACELPDRVNRTTVRLLRAEKDVGSLLASVRQEGSESRRRDDNLREAISDLYRICSEILAAVRELQNDKLGPV